MTPLRQRMLEDLQIRNYSPNTVAAYIRRVAEFAKHYSNTLHRSVSIDRIPLPRYEKKLPVILSPAEVQRLLETPKNLSHRTILTTMYAAGPRLSEVAKGFPLWAGEYPLPQSQKVISESAEDIAQGI